MKSPTLPRAALAVATLSVALLTACAGPHHGMGHSSAMMSAPAGVMTHMGMLTGANGMTLYTFDKDMAGSGKSVCTGPCAANWPPLMASAGEVSGGYSVVTRDDGSKQLAYKGKPLYFWVKDGKPGDTTGDGFNGVWHVARP